MQPPGYGVRRMDTKQLIEAAMQATGAPSVRAFAQGRPFSHVAVSRWLSGEREPDFEQVMELAELAGLDPVMTAAEVRQNTRSGARYRRLLQRLARQTGRAAAVVYALGGTVLTSWNVDILSIM
jgi:3,4-dihydroxy-2-butanone 4-phosphate synthase